MPAQSQVLCS